MGLPLLSCRRMTQSMRLNLQRLNVRPLDLVDAWVERQIRALASLRQIDEANVRLIRLAHASPAFQVHVHLVTPGPDVFAESRDHTLRAAFVKAMCLLRQQIASRAGRRLQRLKSNLRSRPHR